MLISFCGGTKVFIHPPALGHSDFSILCDDVTLLFNLRRLLREGDF